MANLHLLIHNIAGIISIILMIGLALFLYLNNPKSRSAITFSLLIVSVIVFIASHILGVNISDPYVSRGVLMLNLSIFFIPPLNLHLVLATLNKEKERWLVLYTTYFAAFVATIWFAIMPSLFLLPSVPKMYFPNYYEPGILNWTRVIFMYCVVIPYIIYELFSVRKKTENETEKEKFKYLIITMLLGYGFGFVPNFLVYGINIDPLIGILLVSTFVLPAFYASVRYGLFDIKVIAKQAFFYSVAVTFVGGMITFLNYSNNWIAAAYPGFPIWLMPLISAVLAVTIGILVWRHLRQGDLMKYEFITVVTHKFRTPLTHIKWASESLVKSKLDEDGRLQLGYIEDANNKLVELTNLLVNVSETENNIYKYRMDRNNVSKIAEEVILAVNNNIKAKSIDLIKKIEPELYANCDISRIHFVLQVFLENAVRYTKEPGTITVSVYRYNANVVCAVRDTGIGIPKNEIGLLFTKFYRGVEAKLADTEGMGIGLYMSKEIIGKHHGKIWAESDGLNKGSTFAFSLKTAD